MSGSRAIAATLVVVLTACIATAERPPEQKGDAQLVVSGQLVNVNGKEEKIGEDGILMHYEAELKVANVDKGEGVKAGDTIKVTWIHATKKPSGAFAGAFGHNYNVKKGDRVQAYLMKRDGGTWEVIYNPQGMGKK